MAKISIKKEKKRSSKKFPMNVAPMSRWTIGATLIGYISKINGKQNSGTNRLSNYQQVRF